MPIRSTPHPLAVSVGQRIRALRHEKGLTLAALAEQSAIGARHLSSVERGVVVIQLGTARKIAQGLQVRLLDLFIFPDQDDRQRLIDAMRHASAHEMALLKTQIDRLSPPTRSTPRHRLANTPMRRRVDRHRESHSSPSSSPRYVRP
jgi:transcriptional regulator with XRE-family HTH domain